jgi:hypothetical protein
VQPPLAHLSSGSAAASRSMPLAGSVMSFAG